MSRRRQQPDQAGFTLLLTTAAGIVDGVGFLVLFHMFTAHMSGNSIAMGVYAGQFDWPMAFHRGFPIPMFVLGVFLGALLNECLQRRQVRARLAIAFGLEALLLGFFMLHVDAVPRDEARPFEFTARFYLLAALPALAMGLQNATLRSSGGAAVRTTFISGTLTTLAEEAARHLLWLLRRRRHGWLVLARLSWRQPACRRLLLLLGIWLTYVVGAVGGALATVHYGALALAVAIVCLLLAVAWDLLVPCTAN